MRPGPGEETPEERRRREERERRRREERRDAAEDAADSAGEVLDLGPGIGLPGGRGGGTGRGTGGDAGGGSGGSGGSGITGGPGGSGVSGGSGGGSGCGSDGGSRGGSGDGCGACDCNLPLLGLLRLSTLLLLAATVLPDPGGTGLARSLIGFYRRRLTRFTPPCPSTPSCSAYALAAVETRGVRAGLAMASRRIRACGSTGQEHSGDPGSRATTSSTSPSTTSSGDHRAMTRRVDWADVVTGPAE